MSITIAAVDDNEAILDSVKMLLEGVGWPTRIYATEKTFLEDLKSYTPNCVILDPHLAGISGVVAACVLEPNIPFIGLTASPNSAISTTVKQAGALIMMLKPVTAEELIKNIGSAIRAAPLYT